MRLIPIVGYEPHIIPAEDQMGQLMQENQHPYRSCVRLKTADVRHKRLDHVDLLERRDNQELKVQLLEEFEPICRRVVGARPKASSITTNRNDRDLASPHSSPNW